MSKILTKANIAYALCCNIPVSFCLCLAANLINNGGVIDWASVGFNYAISLPVAILISLFVPLVSVGKWFTSLFGIKHDTFTHNLHYRVLAIFIASVIYFVILNPILAIANGLASQQWMGINRWVFSWLRSIPSMLIVGFFSSLFFDIPAYKIAHKIDPNF